MFVWKVRYKFVLKICQNVTCISIFKVCSPFLFILPYCKDFDKSNLKNWHETEFFLNVDKWFEFIDILRILIHQCLKTDTEICGIMYQDFTLGILRI